MKNQRKISLLASTLLLLLDFALNCQTDSLNRWQFEYLKNAAFCRPFVSETENNLTQIEVHQADNRQEYDLSNCGRPKKIFQYTAIGGEVPWLTLKERKNGQLKHEFAISTGLGFHLWWDPLEISTSPILTTDYRFEIIQLKYLRYTSNSIIKNFSIKINPFNHESTHLGDELMLYRARMHYPIQRVNVSFEYLETQFTLNDPGAKGSAPLSLRAGLCYRLNGSQDYYTVSRTEGDSILAKPTGIKSEFFVAVNYLSQSHRGEQRGWIPCASLEIRDRAIYNYPEFKALDGQTFQIDPRSQRAITLNFYAGCRSGNTKGQHLGIYLHLYSGINPYGQFRNQVNFKSVGLTLVVE